MFLSPRQIAQARAVTVHSDELLLHPVRLEPLGPGARESLPAAVGSHLDILRRAGERVPNRERTSGQGRRLASSSLADFELSFSSLSRRLPICADRLTNMSRNSPIRFVSRAACASHGGYSAQGQIPHPLLVSGPPHSPAREAPTGPGGLRLATFGRCPRNADHGPPTSNDGSGGYSEFSSDLDQGGVPFGLSRPANTPECLWAQSHEFAFARIPLSL